MENCQPYDQKPLVVHSDYYSQAPQQIPQSYPIQIVPEASFTITATKAPAKGVHYSTTTASNDDDGSIPVSWGTVTKYTSIAMGAILLYCGYQACTTGEFECSSSHLPDISHVMGVAPLNKLYAIMLTVYSCVKQGYVRAYHHRLNGIASKCTQNLLLVYATLSIVFGPCIGFFDCYYNMTVHCTVTALFTAGEVLYAYTVIGVMNSSKDKFQGHENSISLLTTIRMVSIVLGAITLGAKAIGYDIGIGGSVIEWVEFEMAFVIQAIFASVMPYTDTFVPKQE